jgi:nucleotide-binding universal stress UspA family protein
MTFRILVALDGSPASEAALGEIERIALGGASVHFLHVVPMLPLRVDATSAGVRAVHDQALSYLGMLREQLPDVRGLDLIRTGDPADAILQAALEFNIDLIAMGASGQTGAAKRRLGSVAETVERGSQLPVLLIRPGIVRTHQGLRRILVPLDASEDSLTILPTIMNMAIRAEAEVVFLHVSRHALSPLPQARSQPELAASEHPMKKLLGLTDRLANSGLDFWQLVAQGDVIEEIVSHAETLEVDMIAMSTSVSKGKESAIVGNAAMAVLERSDRAVLLQRPVVHTPAPKGWNWQ